MTNQFDIAHHLAPYHLIPASLSVADALDTFETEDFALLVDEKQPLTVVQKSHLETIERTEKRALSEVLDYLPPLISISEAFTVLDANYLKLFASLLIQTNVPGFLVQHEQQINGILSLPSLVKAMPQSAISPGTSKGLYGLYGNFLTSPQTTIYVCHKCQPPSRVVEPSRVRGTVSTIPSCPIRPFLHKTMEREQ